MAKRELTDEIATEARKRQARRDLLAAVEERDRLLTQANAEIDRALIAALELGLKSPELRDLIGVSHATFWRRAQTAGWKGSSQNKAAPARTQPPDAMTAQRRHP
jgi:hypothetical protein